MLREQRFRRTLEKTCAEKLESSNEQAHSEAGLCRPPRPSEGAAVPSPHLSL
jgi:hypothetical protein